MSAEVGNRVECQGYRGIVGCCCLVVEDDVNCTFARLG